MALNPSSAASAISSGYNGFVAIGADGKPTGEPQEGDYPTIFSGGYHSYASEGTVPGAISGGGNSQIIESFMRSATGNNSQTVTDFAQALAEYWAGVAVDPGDPAHGGTSVVAVQNDAMSRVSLFKNAILTSYTTSLSTPAFLEFIQNVQTIAVSAIIWTITESMPEGGTQNFTEVIT